MESKKAGKGSFAYAWVLDETEEERTRLVTLCLHVILWNQSASVVISQKVREYSPILLATGHGTCSSAEVECHIHRQLPYFVQLQSTKPCCACDEFVSNAADTRVLQCLVFPSFSS